MHPPGELTPPETNPGGGRHPQPGRPRHAPPVAGLAKAFGSGAMTNTIAELRYADCIFVTGSNTTEAHPIIGLEIKAAVEKNGAALILADPREIDLARYARIWLRHRSGTDVALFHGL